MPSKHTSFVNARLCRGGKLVNGCFAVSHETGAFIETNGYVGVDAIDCGGAIVAPGFLELHMNGLRGLHFTSFDGDEQRYASGLEEVARHLPSTGVTAFYATLPTVSSETFQQILPLLRPRAFPGSASLLGAHAEGPYLHPDKKGAHDASLFRMPSASPRDVFGAAGDSADVLKLVTVAPELPGAAGLIGELADGGIRVSLGHSTASYDAGLAGLEAGATCLTHVPNAMPALHHRQPGLAGLISSPARPFFSVIADGHHVHPSVATVLFRCDPERCVLVTDSIELAGLPDGTYPGHAQIPHDQTKHGTRAVIAGTQTLVGGCASLQECVRNLVGWSGCGIAEAVRCVTETVADMMGEQSRGKLESGRRADFVVLSDGAEVLQTWIEGRKVYDKRDVTNPSTEARAAF